MHSYLFLNKNLITFFMMLNLIFFLKISKVLSINFTENKPINCKYYHKNKL